MPKIEIDGISVDVDAGTTIIEVADRLQIPIPRFCYHPKLSVAANCRMCLVQVEKSNKALPACATPIADGMKVWTTSKETVAAQRAVMEFLLINHPLDCPICDQGGECELQDVSLEYGSGESRYDEPKRAVLDHSLGPLISTEMTRCIHCTRCVRFGDEISGERELGATGRGEFMEIGTFIEHNVNSEVSGNVIDLCPVGALTSKPFRFKARAWELQESPSISAHDCVGSNLFVHAKQQKVMRVVPREEDELNEVWISDRDRFSYEGLLHSDRIRKPLLWKHKFSTVSWIEAMKYAAAGLKLSIDNHGVEHIGVLVSPNASTEELYLLQKFTRSLGCNNIDHRLRQLDFTDQELAPTYPNLGIEFRELAQQDMILLIGCNIAKEQPLASIRIRKAVKHGAKVCSISAVDFHYNFTVAQKAITPLNELINTLAGVAKELIKLKKFNADNSTTTALNDVKVTDAAQKLAAELLVGTKKQIIVGMDAQMHPQASQIFALSNLIAQIIGATCGNFSDGANAAGAWLTGCVPHRLPNGKPNKNIGKHALQMLQEPLKCYILFGIEPEFDSILGAYALEQIKQADFVIAISSFQTDSLLELADVVLPLTQFTEYAGSTININGQTQAFNAAVEPYGESRPGWKILRVLGTLLDLEGFDYNTIDDVRSEITASINISPSLPKWQAQDLAPIVKANNKDLLRLGPLSLYAVDSLVRRSKSLQATKDAHTKPQIAMNANTAQNLNVVAEETVLVNIPGADITTATKLDVQINDRIADFTVVIYQANNHTIELGAPYNKVEVRKC